MARILIVDDTDSQRKSVVYIAKQLGLNEIIEAASEAEAYRLIKEGSSIHLAIIDIALSNVPGNKDGLKVIHKLHEAKPACIIIALTAKYGTAVGIESLNAGSNDFISIIWNHIDWTYLLTERLQLWLGFIEGAAAKAIA